MKAETQATNLPPFPEDYRACGVLLHVTSLPSPYGLGDLGPSAFEWTDWLNKPSQTWWQALPAGPTGYANSPYPAIDGARNQRENVWDYLKRRGESSEIAWELIRLAWSSVAALAMVPLQDVLNLGTDARMNLPSRVGRQLALASPRSHVVRVGPRTSSRMDSDFLQSFPVSSAPNSK